MRDKEFIAITFKSTTYAMKAESTFKTTDLKFRTIPTPREISHSCGLALRFKLEDLDSIREIIRERNLSIDGIFKISKANGGSVAEKLD